MEPGRKDEDKLSNDWKQARLIRTQKEIPAGG
jgi:hypothetical protein